MDSLTRTMTAQEIERMPDDGYRYELVRGEVRLTAPAGFEHGNTAMRLGWRLSRFIEEQRAGWYAAAGTGFVLARDPDVARAPDFAFVRADRIPPGKLPQGYFQGAPDLAVEVTSPSDTFAEVDEKVEDWLQAGTRLVWVVSPSTRTVTVYRPGSRALLRRGDTLDGAEVLPGFTVPVEEVFPVP